MQWSRTVCRNRRDKEAEARERAYIAGRESKFLAKNFIQFVTLGMIALEAVNCVISRVASDSGEVKAYISRKDACVPVVPIFHQ